jgi:hypothetical protein
MKPDRTSLLDKLDKATDRAASFAINRGYPIRISKKSTLIGNTSVEKNAEGLYDVISPNNTVIYENISVFDVAVIIAQRYNSGETSTIKKVLALEEKYEKHHTDMIHYLNCLKGATKKHDRERMAILEDKFQTAEMLAKNARDGISIFKRIK